MNKLPFFTLLSCVLLLSSSCRWTVPSTFSMGLSQEKESVIKKSQDSKTSKNTLSKKEIESLRKDWKSLVTKIQLLPLEIQSKLGSSFYDALKTYALANQFNAKLKTSVALQLKEFPENLPVFSGVSLPFFHQSIYDSQAISYTLKAPLNPSLEQTPLVIFLGTKNDYPQDFSSLNAYLLFLPPRKKMEYHLLGEGDMWHIIQDLQQLYPQLKRAPYYLVGQGPMADQALLLANRHFGFFSGLAFSAGELSFQLPNLQYLPTCHFPSKHVSSPWGGKKLIETLKKRGNRQAFVSNQDLRKSLEKLLAFKKDPLNLPPFLFNDYYHASVNPWLRVVGKKSEKDPVIISTRYEDNILYLEGFNISSVEIDRKHEQDFPKSLNQVRLNQHLFSFQKNRGSLYIGTDALEPKWNHKSKKPPHLINFFRNEPIYIIYQNEGAPEKVLNTIEQIADRFSKMRFLGYPEFDVKLPKYSYSQYRLRQFPEHRAIIIAQEYYASKILQLDHDYLPVKESSQGLLVNGKEYFGNENSPFAYGLIYPPQAVGSLQLACALVAKDSEGFSTLARHYSKATSLEDTPDLIVWKKINQEYKRILDKTYNQAWENSEPPTPLIETPPLSEEVWQDYLENIIQEQSMTDKLATSSLIDPFVPIPVQLTYENIASFIPEKFFAVVSLKDWKSIHIVNKLLNAMENPLFSGFGNLIMQKANTKKFEIDRSHNTQIKELTFTLDAKSLSTLSQEELSYIDYSILPYSLREMLIRKIQNQPADFGRELIRLSNKHNDFSMQTR